MSILEGADVTKYFGGLAAVSNVDFHVDHGEVVGLIGANGAGKTTLLKTISGILRPASGSVKFLGKRMGGLAPLLVKEIFRIIQGLPDRGIAILLIEQNFRQILEIADRAYVLENGHVILAGESKKLLQEELIRKAYLGL